MEQNFRAALNLAVFMNYHKEKVTMEELLTTLVGFSYHGDMRMRMKMENPKKIGNLVQGSLT